MTALVDALLLQAGYNTAVVCVGAGLLGAAAGAIGVFILLRRRALISDAISHATLPGVGLAFLLGVAAFDQGRILPLLLAGAATTGALGVVLVQAITRWTRLPEDAAIGSVLSTFFAAGIVLLTVIQTLQTGGQAGLEGFLLGAAASMLTAEAMTIAAAASIVALAIFALMKEFTAVCFDPEFAAASGYRVAVLDLAMLGLLLAVIVIGLTTVGLILIIALAIIPPVAARFWTERAHRMVLISAAVGAGGSYVGAALSSTAPSLPTGGLIVLVLAALFLVSMLFSPVRGLLAAALAHRRFQAVVHERQGLLALARGEPVFDPLTRRILRRRRFLRRDGTVTEAGRGEASRMVHDQALWNQYRADYPEEAQLLESWSLRPIGAVLPRDLVAELESRLTPHAVTEGP